MSNDIESLARGAGEALALAHRLALIRVESKHRLSARCRSRSNPEQAAASASPPQPAPPNPSPAMPILAAHHGPPGVQAAAAGEHSGASPPTAVERANNRIPHRK